VGGALALAVTMPWQYRWWGRLTALLCAALLGGMAIGITASFALKSYFQKKTEIFNSR
jgi:ABC-type uncharacterized transport system permease subunit